MTIRQNIAGHLRRYSRLGAISAVSAMAVAGLAAGGAAQAATNAPVHVSAASRQAAPDLEYSCFGTPHQLGSRYCYFQTQNGDAPLYNSNGTLWGYLPLNDKVEINCYYYKGSAVEDHVSWTQRTGGFNGHIPDSYVDEGGSNPWDAPGDLPQCG